MKILPGYHNISTLKDIWRAYRYWFNEGNDILSGRRLTLNEFTIELEKDLGIQEQYNIEVFYSEEDIKNYLISQEEEEE